MAHRRDDPAAHHRAVGQWHAPQVYLNKHGQAARADLDALLLPKLRDVLDAAQKANKLKNLLQGMRRAGLVHRSGPRSLGVWRLGPGS